MPEEAQRSAANKIGDVIVLIISLAILVAGFLAWKVYAATDARNAYDVAVGAYTETHEELSAARENAAPLLDNCAERSGLADQCAALQAASEGASFSAPAQMSRLASAQAYTKAASDLNEETSQAAQALAALEENTAPVHEAIVQRIAEKMAPVREPMLEAAKMAAGEITACQDVINSATGQVTNESVLTGAQEAVEQLRGLVNEANNLLTENSEDYTSLTARLNEGTTVVTDWTNQVNLDHWDWATRNGIGQVYDPSTQSTANVAE